MIKEAHDDRGRQSSPPDGDWLGSPFLRFDRKGPFGIVTLNRHDARNAMTPAMYFGIRYAVTHVETDDDLAGLIITGTGEVFAPGGDVGGGNGVDDWKASYTGAEAVEGFVAFKERRSPERVHPAIRIDGRLWLTNPCRCR